MTILNEAYKIVQGSGKVIAVATTEATDTVVISENYVLSTSTDCYVRFSASAVVASDGNFDLFMPAGSIAVLNAQNTTIRVIRSTADGFLGVSLLERS